MVNQWRRTFKTLIVDAVLTMVYSLVFCSRELDVNGLPAVAGCGEAELPPVIKDDVDERINVDPYLVYSLIVQFDCILVIHLMLLQRMLV